MSKLDKRAISILVIAILALSFVLPLVTVSATLDTVLLDAGSGDYGDIVNAYGIAGQVTSGATVEIYWDTAIGDGAWLLNSTTGNADGSWEADFKVPEAITGLHYVWAKDTSGPVYSKSLSFDVVPLVKLSPSSGLKGDDVDVKGYGFGKEVVVGIEFDKWGITGESIGTYATPVLIYSGTLDYYPVFDGAITITAGVETFTGSGAAVGVTTLTGSGIGTGSVTLATGAWTITFDPLFLPVDPSPITATYTRDAVSIEISVDFKTDELGSFTKTFDIPDFPYGTTYSVSAAPPLTAATLIIGASITVSPDEGPTGSKVTVEGRGWTPGNTIKFYDEAAPGTAIEVVDRDVITVGSGGTFSADVIIPVLGSVGDYKIEAVETIVAPNPGANPPSSDKFELTGVPEVVVSPTYGTPGSTIIVTGSNFTQIAGIDVTVTLSTSPTPFELVIAKTNSDGTFEDTFMSPAVLFQGYTVTAKDEYFIEELDAFKVGLIALIINPVYGEAGTKISITGIGFLKSQSYNVTFGDKLYEDYGTVSIGEAISATFYIPNVETGTYDLTVIDSEDNELSCQFSVTAVTEVDLDPAMAPNTYNVTIEGYNFADKDLEEVYFVLYNVTTDGEVDKDWDMNVWQNGAGDDPVETGVDGNFTAWWWVLPEADLSLGDYTINVTGYDDFLLQVPFSVVEARVSVAPRKALFDRGDTIQFNVKNDFDFDKSYMKIWDPDDNLYWKTEDFTSWLKVGDLYTVPYYLQTSGRNPMTLAQDAPLGTWFYVFYEEGTTQLTNGTFVVGPSSAAQVDEKLSEIWGSLDSLTSNIDSITDEIEDDIGALAGDIADIASEVDDLKDEIVADLADDIAAAADAAEEATDAVSDLAGMVGDIADAVTDAASAADSAVDAANDAKTAAESSQTTAQGLTTLVYGAIGASLVAALAAIVSLMQISKKIA